MKKFLAWWNSNSINSSSTDTSAAASPPLPLSDPTVASLLAVSGTADAVATGDAAAGRFCSLEPFFFGGSPTQPFTTTFDTLEALQSQSLHARTVATSLRAFLQARSAFFAQSAPSNDALFASQFVYNNNENENEKLDEKVDYSNVCRTLSSDDVDVTTVSSGEYLNFSQDLNRNRNTELNKDSNRDSGVSGTLYRKMEMSDSGEMPPPLAPPSPLPLAEELQRAAALPVKRPLKGIDDFLSGAFAAEKRDVPNINNSATTRAAKCTSATAVSRTSDADATGLSTVRRSEDSAAQFLSVVQLPVRQEADGAGVVSESTVDHPGLGSCPEPHFAVDATSANLATHLHSQKYSAFQVISNPTVTATATATATMTSLLAQKTPQMFLESRRLSPAAQPLVQPTQLTDDQQQQRSAQPQLSSLAQLYPELVLLNRLSPHILRSPQAQAAATAAEAAAAHCKPIPNNERVDLLRFRLKEPSEWGADDVVAWMLDVARRHRIPCENLNMHRFAKSNGPLLMLMTERNFVECDPVYGALLYAEFRRLATENNSLMDSIMRSYKTNLAVDTPATGTGDLTALTQFSAVSAAIDNSTVAVPFTATAAGTSGVEDERQQQKQINGFLAAAVAAAAAKAAVRSPLSLATAFPASTGQPQLQPKPDCDSLAAVASAQKAAAVAAAKAHQQQLLQQQQQTQQQQQRQQFLIEINNNPLNGFDVKASCSNIFDSLPPPQATASTVDFDASDKMANAMPTQRRDGAAATTREQPKIRKNKDGRPRKRSQHTKGNKLWEFIRDALRDPSTCPSVVKWEDSSEGVFRIVESEKLARLWGNRKNNQKMTYEKLSRAMRTYYEKQILVPVPKTGLYPKKLVYKFGPYAHGWNARPLAIAMSPPAAAPAAALSLTASVCSSALCSPTAAAGTDGLKAQIAPTLSSYHSMILQQQQQQQLMLQQHHQQQQQQQQRLQATAAAHRLMIDHATAAAAAAEAAAAASNCLGYQHC